MKKFDYSTTGAYFLTICTKDRKHILSSIPEHIPNDASVGAFLKPQLTEIGENVEKQILSIPEDDNVSLESYVIMPNHIHLVVVIRNNKVKDLNGENITSRANEAIPSLVSALKRLCNKQIGYNIFQRSYHDHVIRNKKDYEKITEYIYKNPMVWQHDCFYNSPEGNVIKD